MTLFVIVSDTKGMDLIMAQIHVLRLGKKEYMEVLELQRRLQQLRIENKIGNVLILVEHTPVLTLGRSGKYSNIVLDQIELEKNGVKIVEVERGGDVTYHGPGQIVGYLIFDLRDFGRDTHSFVSKIQEGIVSFLNADYNINAEKRSGRYTGVWIDDKKIAAIGLNMKNWVSIHGFALNVNTNLNHFKWIIPCGLADSGVTSLQEQIGREADLKSVAERIAYYFSQVFESDIKNILLEELGAN